MLGAEVGLDAAQGEVHDGEAAGGGVALFLLISHQPHPSGSTNETKPALPSHRFVLAAGATELIGGKPELLLEAEIDGGVVPRGRASSRHFGQGVLKMKS